MKLKLYTFPLLLSLLLSLPTLQAQLVNGDMESWTGGMPDGWTTIESGITLAEENTIIHGGNASASVNVTTSSQGDTDFRQTISVIAGTTYDVSFWVYHTEGGVRARMYVETFQEYTLPELVGQWQELTLTYEASTTGDIEVGLRFYDVAANFDGEEIVYVDDYTFTPQVVTDPNIVITSPAEGSTSTSEDVTVEFVVQNFDVSITGTGDGTVMGTLIAPMASPVTTPVNNTDPIELTGLENGDYQVILELVDNNSMSLNPPATDTVNFTVAVPSLIEVANLAELRAGTIGESYRITGEVWLTYQQTFRNQKYIQDATAGILIDDDPGTITSTYAVNDGITGMTGTLGEFGGMLQFNPLQDPGAASSNNNVIPIQVVTLADLTSNFEDHESEVVTVNDVTFSDAGMIFENGTEYAISDPSSSYNFRTTFFSVDYIGTEIPTTGSVSGIPNSRFEGDFFTARNLADFDFGSSTEDLSITNFSLAPNPNRGEFYLQNEGVAGDYQLVIFDALGKVVQAEQFYLAAQEQKIIRTASKYKGLYLVQLQHLTENYRRTVRMVIE